MLEHVLPLLLQALLDEDLVDHLETGDDLHPLVLAEDRVAALFGEVQRVGGHPDDEPVAERGRSVEHPDVPDVQDIEGSEGDHGSRAMAILLSWSCCSRPVWRAVLLPSYARADGKALSARLVVQAAPAPDLTDARNIPPDLVLALASRACDLH